MYSVSSSYLSGIVAIGRKLTARITLVDFSTTIGTDKISNITYTETTNSGNVLTMGCACSHELKATIFNPPSGIAYENAKIFVETGLKIGSSYEYVPFGYFWITKAEFSNNKNVLDITAYDSMCKLQGKYVPTVGSSTTLQAIYNDIKTQLATSNIVLKTRTCPSYSISNFPSLDITFQQAVGYLAGCLGGFARFDRDGELEVAWYTDNNQTITKALQYMDGLDVKTEQKTIKAIVTGTKDHTITLGSGTLGITLNFENPWITNAMATDIYNDVLNDSFYPCDLSWIGNPAIMAGDGITYVDESGNNRYAYITTQTFSYDGGLRSNMECCGESTSEVVFTGEYSTVPRKTSSLQRAIEDATRLITGNQGGYVVMHDSNGDGQPDEILVMDTPNIDTAVKIWRWNKQGLGYSSTGYNGTYGTAINSDGQIVADYVSAGTLQGIRIIANIGSIGGWSITSDGIEAEDDATATLRYAIKLISDDGSNPARAKLVGYRVSDDAETFKAEGNGAISCKIVKNIDTGHRLTQDYTSSDVGKVLTVSMSGTEPTLTWQTGGSGGGMENPMTAVGDLIVGGSVVGGKATPTKMTKGSNGQVLMVNSSGVLTYGNVGMTTAGDMIYGGTNGIPTRLAMGNTGTFLRMQSNGVPIWSNALNRGDDVTTSNTSYGTAMARAIYAGTSAMTAGSSALTSGTIYLQYE